VLVVDDQTLVRQGIRSLLGLAHEVEVVGEAADGKQALAAIEALSPEVVLLDLRMPVLDGLGVLRELATRGRHTPVLVLTTFADDDAVLDSLRAGARGYLLKDVTLEQLVDAITTLAAGGSLVQPAVTDAVARSFSRAPGTVPLEVDQPPEALTPREAEILRLLAGGYSNKEIAGVIHLSTGTVKNHVSAVLLKLGVRDRTRAVLRALELGLITR
jgi:DNA-binding NarL/FixJ family response regulator